MKRISKWLVPRFLLRLDRYLLENMPAFWRLKVHYITFYALVASVLLFGVGYFYPVSYDQLTVDPIKPIEIYNEASFIAIAIFLLLGVTYWGYHLFKMGPFPPSLKLLLVRFISCYLVLFVLFGITATSFRLGTLVKSAYGLMDLDDVIQVTKNNYYRFGIHPLEKVEYTSADSVYWGPRVDTFLSITEHEDLILTNRYNKSFFDQFLKNKRSYRLQRTYQLFGDYRQEMMNLSDRVYLPFISFLPSKSDRTGILDLSYPKEPPDSVNTPYELYLFYRTEFKYLSSRLDLTDLANYSDYYRLNKYINDSLLTKYEIPFAYEELVVDSITLTIPKFAHQLEDLTRSVEHARLYLKDQIILRYLRSLLLILPLLTILLLSAPYLKLTSALGVAVVYLILLLGVNYIVTTYIRTGKSYSHYFFSVLSVLILIVLLCFSLKKKVGLLSNAVFHFLMICLLSILFSIFFGDDIDLLSQPTNLPFFSMQFIGFCTLWLMMYLEHYPKKA